MALSVEKQLWRLTAWSEPTNDIALMSGLSHMNVTAITARQEQSWDLIMAEKTH